MIVEAALASHLSPDGADRLEAALARRLDRMTRHMERIERHVTISNEALAVFVRFWLTSTPPLPDTALAAAQTKGRERYEGYVEALGRRLARGRKLADEVIRDIDINDSDEFRSLTSRVATLRRLSENHKRYWSLFCLHYGLFHESRSCVCTSRS